MLETVRKLKDSITNSQTRDLMERLGDEDWGLLKAMLFAATEDDVIRNKEAFKVAIRKRNIPFLLSLHKLLNAEQQRLFNELL